MLALGVGCSHQDQERRHVRRPTHELRLYTNNDAYVCRRTAPDTYLGLAVDELHDTNAAMLEPKELGNRRRVAAESWNGWEDERWSQVDAVDIVEIQTECQTRTESYVLIEIVLLR